MLFWAILDRYYILISAVDDTIHLIPRILTLIRSELQVAIILATPNHYHCAKLSNITLTFTFVTLAADVRCEQAVRPRSVVDAIR